MLLMSRRPSEMISRMWEKSESSSTTCAAWRAASEPAPMAMEQSASFMARMSLTPSPVMATRLPVPLRASTSCFFCSGFTRPKTT